MPLNHLSRRLRSAAALVTVAASAVALSGCSSAAPSAGSTTKAAWSFTDDLGKTVTLDHAPTRVAGLNDEVVSLMQYGIEPVAMFGSLSIAADPRFDDLDTASITEVGTQYGEINLEKLAEAQPDVIVSQVYPTDRKGTIDETQPDFGFQDLAQQKQIEKIAPIVTIVMGGHGDDVVASNTKLARALGASPAKLASTKKAYEAASDKLKAAAKENDDLKVIVAYADSDGYDVVKSPDDPELQLYSDLGVDFVQPTPAGYYWGLYSWENAGKAGGDLILLSQSGYQRAELSKQPTLANTAAVEADQIRPWVSAGLDYVSQAAFMTQLAGYIASAKVVTD